MNPLNKEFASILVRAAVILTAIISVLLTACEAGHKETAKSESSHGAQQLQKMLADRLQMNAYQTPQGPGYVSLDDSFCQWAIEQFNHGGEANVRVYWDSQLPTKGLEAGHSVEHAKGELLSVRVRDETDSTLPDEAFETMWSGLIYELGCYQDMESVLTIYQQARSGHLNRSQFVREIAKIEYLGLQRSEDFWTTIWNPWSTSCGFATRKTIWFRRGALPFDEWFTKQVENEKQSGYPTPVLGSIYDWLQQNRDTAPK